MPEPSIEHKPVARTTIAVQTRAITSLLKGAGLPSPNLDARLIVAEACGLDSERAILERDRVVTAAQLRKLANFAARRMAGEPVSRILGRREFWGLPFKLSPATLDPRPESELLIEVALDHIRRRGDMNRPLRILDLGTGSGCLLAALLSELPRSSGIGIDRSEAALATARENLSELGLLNRAFLLCAHWMGAIAGTKFDIILCNPPYVETSGIRALGREVSRFDPHLALDGGADGFNAYREVIPQAFDALSLAGLLILEVGEQQAQTVKGFLKQFTPSGGFVETSVHSDLSGVHRAVAGVRQL
jgi:release factor glutamine methyltransferase